VSCEHAESGRIQSPVTCRRIGLSAFRPMPVRRSMFGVRGSALLPPIAHRLMKYLVTVMCAGTPLSSSVAKETISGSDGATIALSRSDSSLVIEYRCPADDQRTIFVAIGSHNEIGSAVIPFAEHQEGSTVFLPFKADRLFALNIGANSLEKSVREWHNWRWQEPRPAEKVDATPNGNDCTVQIPLSGIGSAKSIDLAIYAKSFASNSWGQDRKSVV